MTTKPKFGKGRKEQNTCQRCQYKFPLSRTQCPSCGYWNIEQAFDTSKDGTVLLSDAEVVPVKRLVTGPWDPCWGAEVETDGEHVHGIVQSSVTLLGGAPGAGKSTLSLQLADSIAGLTGKEVLYISAEEANAQIRSRADRLKLKNTRLIRLRPIGAGGDIGDIMTHRKPVAIIADSLPKICPDMADAVIFAERIKDYTIALNAPAIIIDHVTKEEEFAGLQALQHAVDTTLLFTVYPDEVRELRTVKNRNGPSGIRTHFTMEEAGLQVFSLDADDEDEDGDDDE